MSRRVQRPHCFLLRCDVRFRISPADIVKPYRGSAGLVTAPNLVRCAALNSYLSATAAERPSKAVTGWTIDSYVSNGTELTGPALHNLTRNELWQKQTGGLRIIPITALPPIPAPACSPTSQTFPPPRRLLLFAVRFNINLPSPAQHRQHQVNFPIHNPPPPLQKIIAQPGHLAASPFFSQEINLRIGKSSNFSHCPSETCRFHPGCIRNWQGEVCLFSVASSTSTEQQNTGLTAVRLGPACGHSAPRIRFPPCQRLSFAVRFPINLVQPRRPQTTLDKLPNPRLLPSQRDNLAVLSFCPPHPFPQK